MKLDIRPMTMVEYDALRDYIEDLEKQGVNEEKMTRKIAMYVCEKVAGMDLNDKTSTIKKVMTVYEKIMKATSDEQAEEEKN